MPDIYEVISGSNKRLTKIYEVVGGADKELTKIYEVVNGQDKLIYSSAITQDIALPANRYVTNFPDFPATARGNRGWRFPAGSRPAIASDFGASRYVTNMNISTTDTRNPRRVIFALASSLSGSDTTGADLSTDFESRGVITITLSGGASLTLNMADYTDNIEPYSLNITNAATRTAFDTFVAAMSNNSAQQAATLTLTLPS